MLKDFRLLQQEFQPLVSFLFRDLGLFRQLLGVHVSQSSSFGQIRTTLQGVSIFFVLHRIQREFVRGIGNASFVTVQQCFASTDRVVFGIDFVLVHVFDVTGSSTFFGGAVGRILQPHFFRVTNAFFVPLLRFSVKAGTVGGGLVIERLFLFGRQRFPPIPTICTSGAIQSEMVNHL